MAPIFSKIDGSNGRVNANVAVSDGSDQPDDLSDPLSNWDTNFDEGTFNTALKDACEAAFGFVPGAGPFLSAIIDALWPTPQVPDQTWANIRGKVEGAIHVAIDKERARTFKSRIDSLRESINYYQKFTDYSDPLKGAMLVSIIEVSRDLEPEFFSSKPHEWKRIMPYFVSLGSLRLSLLFEMYIHWDKLNNKPDSNKASPNRLVAKDELHNTIIKFLGPLYHIRSTAIAWRKNQITYIKNLTSPGLGEWTWDVEDALNAKARRHWYGAIPGHGTEAEADAKNYYDKLVKETETEFTAQLDLYLEPTKSWMNFAQGESLGFVFPWYLKAAPIGQGNRLESYENYGFRGYEVGWRPVEMTEFDDEHKYFEHGPLTEICLRTGSLIDGIEVYYGHKGAGFRGNKDGGGEKRIRLSKEDIKGRPDKVIDIIGRGDYSVEYIRFKSFSGQEISGGDEHGSVQSFVPPHELPPHLTPEGELDWMPTMAWCKGKYSSGRLEQLEVTWVFNLNGPRWW